MNPQTNVNNAEGSSNQGNIMKELSDIKESLATNTEATSNVKIAIGEIKVDIREIKNNSVTQEQHKELTELIKDHEKRVFALENSKISITILLSIGTGILTLLTSLMIYHLTKM
jgi:hypothetical protein